jgi:hypothetical protein
VISEQPTIGNLCRITGGMFTGRLGYLLAIEHPGATVRLFYRAGQAVRNKSK